MIKSKELLNFTTTDEFKRRKRNQSLYSRASNYFDKEEYPVNEDTFMTLNR